MIAKTNDLGLTQVRIAVRVNNAKYCVESLLFIIGDDMKLCGYCEYGYRLFMTDCGKVYRLPIPTTEVF